MPTSVQSAVSASARLSVDSDGDREPARDNVPPSDVNDHGRTSARTLPLHRDAGAVNGDKLALDNRLRFPDAVADVDPLAVEPVIVGPPAEGSLRARRGHLQVVLTVDETSAVEQRTGNTADALAVFDGDRLVVVNRDAQCSARMAGLLERVQLVPHVIEGGLEQFSD